MAREVLRQAKGGDTAGETGMPDQLSRIRALEAELSRKTQECEQLTGQLKAALEESERRAIESAAELAKVIERYELALRGSNVAVFTQDLDLRYTSITRPMFGRREQEFEGRTDEELLGSSAARELNELKREVLQSGRAISAELHIGRGDSSLWYDFHFEALRDEASGLTGLTGTAVDITERKENETHLRLLMRELTHRSKNLLAVIQAMARQTARHSENIDIFIDRFSARLQALARAHDLLVAASWHGAPLPDLVRAQLGPYIDRTPEQFEIRGPDVQLRPESAQSFALALHELVVNAAKYGALSTPKGRVSITWQQQKDGKGVDFVWRESGGPAVVSPAKRGFGSMVIEHNLARVLHANVTLCFEPDGLVCCVTIPESQLVAQT